MSKPHKVFGIGFHKTATTSLDAALTKLGYRVTGPNLDLNPVTDPDFMKRVHEVVAAYDAFQDNPWPILFRALDEAYPGSKFILTVRPTDRWLNSLVGHFGKRKTNMRQWIYGTAQPKGNEQLYTERYESHNREVIDYFRDRPDDLLVMRITEGDGWEKLCPFLGEPVPRGAFPQANKGMRRKIKRWIQRILPVNG